MFRRTPKQQRGIASTVLLLRNSYVYVRSTTTIHLHAGRVVAHTQSSALLLPLSNSHKSVDGQTLAGFDGDLANQAAALKLIAETANQLCTEIPLEGSASEAEVSGKVSARVNGLAKKLADLGVEGGGGY